MKRNIVTLISATMIAFLTLPSVSSAYNDSKDSCTVPPGTSIYVLYYDHTTAHEVYADGSKVGENTNFTANIGLFRYVTYFETFGDQVGCFNFIVPYGDVSLDGSDLGQQNISGTGMGDLVLDYGFSIIYKPQQKTWLNFDAALYLPTGEYSNDKAVNIGANRWQLKPAMNGCRYLTENLAIEFFASADIYSDNDDYGPGKVTLEQDPVYYVNTHLIYDINPSIYVSTEYYYEYGGETTIDDVDQSNERNDHYLQFTYAQMLTQNFQLMIKYKTPLKVENGSKASTFGIRLSTLLF